MPRLSSCSLLMLLAFALGSFDFVAFPKSRFHLTSRRCGRSDQCSWWWKGGPGEESEEDIIVFVPIAEDVRVEDVQVDIRRTHLTVSLCEKVLLDGALWKEIKAEDSGWLIDREAGQRCILITLIKRDVWIDYDYLFQTDADEAKSCATNLWRCFRWKKTG
ncbi:unnamed protein product [Durusdinium trenchii]|uniref:CS domain-containing protein n=1 Tax=Durusdinium trenchii TaxID=1381693 RepID=A0ABP0SN43_9DINO